MQTIFSIEGYVEKTLYDKNMNVIYKDDNCNSLVNLGRVNILKLIGGSLSWASPALDTIEVGKAVMKIGSGGDLEIDDIELNELKSEAGLLSVNLIEEEFSIKLHTKFNSHDVDAMVNELGMFMRIGEDDTMFAKHNYEEMDLTAANHYTLAVDWTFRFKTY